MQTRQTLDSWLHEGPFTLALSSSFFGFFAHCGVAQALFERGHRPAKITGSSAGALVGGAIASGLAPETMRDLLFRVRREDFWDPRPGLGYLRGKKFEGILAESFSPSFAEAALPFEAAAFDLLSLRTRFLAEGPLPRAVVASCAVPLLFHPVRIGRRLYLDGGLFQKSGISPSAAEERVLCIFLQGEKGSEAYELGDSLKKLGPGHRVLRFEKLPRLDYSNLERGKLAFAEAYRRARSSFTAVLEGGLANASA